MHNASACVFGLLSGCVCIQGCVCARLHRHRALWRELEKRGGKKKKRKKKREAIICYAGLTLKQGISGLSFSFRPIFKKKGALYLGCCGSCCGYGPVCVKLWIFFSCCRGGESGSLLK